MSDDVTKTDHLISMFVVWTSSPSLHLAHLRFFRRRHSPLLFVAETCFVASLLKFAHKYAFHCCLWQKRITLLAVLLLLLFNIDLLSHNNNCLHSTPAQVRAKPKCKGHPSPPKQRSLREWLKSTRRHKANLSLFWPGLSIFWVLILSLSSLTLSSSTLGQTLLLLSPLVL